MVGYDFECDGITVDDEEMETEMSSWYAEPLLGSSPPAPEPAAEDQHERPKSDEKPKSDKQAVETLYEIAGGAWKTVNGVIYVYRHGLWTQDEAAFLDLMMQHSGALGEYGEAVQKMRHVMALAKTKNLADDSWTQRLDRLGPGLVPFANGIYDIASSTLRDFEPDDMITKKFDFNAPSVIDEDVSAEINRLQSVFRDLLPDEQLLAEVMVRLAESFFSCSNTHKYFVQLYGEGNNGKTTLMRMLQTAFPQWVKMPSVEHLVVKGAPRDPNAPQPWLVDVMGARILGFEEPGEKRAFDGALLKLLRGNGIVTGRALYKGNVSYVPTFTLWIAANDPIEIKPHDRAVQDSLHSFHLPSYFSDGGAPLGTRFPKKKIPNLEEWFTERRYTLALFQLLREYYATYARANSLPPLVSAFAMTRLYADEHPTIREHVDSCFEVDSSCRLRAKRAYEALEAAGCTESHKKMRLVMLEHFKEHAAVKLHKLQNVLTWSGLCLRDSIVGEHLF